MSTERASSAGILAASRRRTLARLRFAVAMAVVLPLAGLAAAAAFLYRESFDEAARGLDAATRIAQEHAQKMLETNEMLLERMLDLLGGAADEELLARGEQLHARLKAMTDGLPQVQGFFAIGADGRMLATNRAFPPPRHIDFSDREFIAAHRAGVSSRVFVTGHLVSRVTGDAFFDMSRRREHADGSYAGTVNVSLYPSYLTQFWKEMTAAVPGMRVTLLRGDGRLIARHPGGVPEDAALAPEHPLMQRIAAGGTGGDFDSVSPFDGMVRLAAYRKVGDYPVYLTAGVGRNYVLGAWARQIGLLTLFVIPLACALAWTGWVALKRTREELEAAERLEEETARRSRTELALAQSQKLETVGHLAGGVAHDFNNLLMIVSSNLHLLRQRLGSSADRELAAIGRAVQSGTRLTRQLLALSGRQPLAPEHLVLQDRLPALLSLVRPALPASIGLHARVEPDTAPISVDAGELELALINLALNARDAMPGGGSVTISAGNAPGGSEVTIEVSDTGPGIDPAILGRVLEPFFTTKPEGKGTGLGLTQVQALCRGAGGRIELDSPPGGGARVRLHFPRSAAPVPAPDVPAERSVALRCHVLLAEDNDAVAQAIAALLQSMECTVRRAASAQAALDAADAEPFDVVLSDIEMPGGMDGIDLAARLARRNPALPVVLMTGYASRLDQASARGLTVVMKPCSASALRDAIANARERSAMAA